MKNLRKFIATTIIEYLNEQQILSYQDVTQKQKIGDPYFDGIFSDENSEFVKEKIHIEKLRELNGFHNDVDDELEQTVSNFEDIGFDEDYYVSKKLMNKIVNGTKLNPIVVDEKYKILDGRHRLAAYSELWFYYGYDFPFDGNLEIYKRIIAKGWTIKLPDSVPPAVSKSFSAMIPGSVTLSMFLVIRILFGLTSYGNIHDFVYTVIQTPLVALGGGLPATIVAVLLIQLLWFFGLHGQIIINSVLDPVWNTLSLQNLDALQAGKELPNIITKQFIDTYTVGIGGTGMTLAVVAAMLFVMKSKQLRETGKIAAPAGIFNVNEPVIFGLPIVMNPMIFIPWLLAPVVVVIFTYFMMATGIVPLTTGISVPWTMPIFFGGMLATNSIMGGILQIINFFIVFFIWVPFLKIMDIQNLRAEKEVKVEGEYDFSL